MDIDRAKKIQNRLRQKLKIIPLRKKIRTIAGVDAAFGEDRIIGTACLFSFPDLNFLEEAWAIKKLSFPYIPGYLSFREAPVVLAALKKLTVKPDLILVDGQGIAHPRRMGIASHLGVLWNVPTIGCAKSRLVGAYQEPGMKKGDWSPLRLDQEVVGAVLRTRGMVSPIFISPGHKIELPESISIVLKTTTVFRISEPLRRADQLSKIIKRDIKTKK
jgi:deoxyribonuclease V